MCGITKCSSLSSLLSFRYENPRRGEARFLNGTTGCEMKAHSPLPGFALHFYCTCLFSVTFLARARERDGFVCPVFARKRVGKTDRAGAREVAPQSREVARCSRVVMTRMSMGRKIIMMEKRDTRSENRGALRQSHRVSINRPRSKTRREKNNEEDSANEI